MFNTDEFLRSQKVMRLATVDGEGFPHVVPVWYIFKEQKFYVGTGTRTKKARNVIGRSEVGFCVDVGVRSPEIAGVGGRGRARVITETAEVKRIATEILLKYFDSLESEAAKELLDETDCVIEILPAGHSSWRY